MPSRPTLAIVGAVLAAAGALLWLFSDRLDRPLAATLHLAPDYAYLPSVIVLTRLGGAAVMIPAAIAGVLLLAIRGDRQRAAWLVVTIASGRLTVALLKMIVGRARPDIAGQLVHVGSASFPSSHSAGSMLTVAALLLAFRAPASVAALAFAWPVAIGLTRVLLGVHWPSDVLAGWGLALLWAALAARWLPPGRGAAPTD